ncbi:MAG: glycosyltransferase family 2 protein [Pseudomonadales bacterium]
MAMLNVSISVGAQEINSLGARDIASQGWFNVKKDNTLAYTIVRSDGESFPAGWLLLRAKLEREGEQLEATLCYSRAGGEAVELGLPISLKGTLLELVNIPPNVRQLILRPMRGAGRFRISQANIKHVGLLERLYRMWWRVASMFEHHPYDRLYKSGLRWYTPLLSLKKAYELSAGFRAYSPVIPYDKWIARFDDLDDRDIRKIKRSVKRWKHPPTIDLLFLDNDSPFQENDCASQLYPFFNIVSSNQLKNDWVLCVQPGVVFRPHALYWFAAAIAENPDAVAFYSDHDLLSEDGIRCAPSFKPDWSPELLLADQYTGPVLLIKKSLLVKELTKKAGQADDSRSSAAPSCNQPSFNQFSCYQLALACLESSRISGSVNEVVHIPAVLYHWKKTVEQVDKANHKTRLDNVKQHLRSVNGEAQIESLNGKYNKVVYTPVATPLISIVIPTRDTLYHLERSVMSVLEQSTYRNFEIVIADNQSCEPETHAFFERVSQYENVSVVPYDFPFNYSSINNFAVEHSSGDVVLLLNNDTEVISDNWMEVMLGQLQQSNVGAVGVKLLFGDRHVQHAGDAVGPGGCADHFHSRLGEDEPGYAGRAILAQDLSAVTAACLMVTRSLWEKLGGLDEKNLAVAFNDVDFCLRVREAGYRVVYTPYAKLYHHESVSRGKDDNPVKAARAKSEANYMRSRWKHIMNHDPFYNPNLNYSRPDFKLSHAPMIDKPWLK